MQYLIKTSFDLTTAKILYEKKKLATLKKIPLSVSGEPHEQSIDSVANMYGHMQSCLCCKQSQSHTTT